MNPIKNIPTDELTYELWKRANTQAELEADWVRADHSRNIILAEIATPEPGESDTAANKRARKSKAYIDHIDSMANIKRDLIIARAARDVVDHEIRLRINKSFSDRTEYQGGHLNT